MRKLPFSYDAIREVYDTENRRGNMDLSLLPTEYQNLIKLIHEKRAELSNMRKVSAKKMDSDAQAAHLSQIETKKEELKELAIDKENLLTTILLEMEKRINSKAFVYEIERDVNLYGGHEYFHTKGNNLDSLIMSKLLCRDLAATFKVKAANRHHIMSCVKSLLVKDKRFIIIRTDIQSFFESIPHDNILTLIGSNPFVSKKTIGCIRNILMQYDKLKTLGKQGIGVPRGVAVSSYLSEILLRDFDMKVKRFPNVLFYARYVDDIIILISHIQPCTTIDNFFDRLKDEMNELNLSLHPKGTGKTQLVEYCPGKPKAVFEYLGYKITLVPSCKSINFTFSNNRYNRLVNRIDNAFQHFEQLYRSNPRQARRDLIDSMKLLSGNMSLHKTKSGVKTGMYYSHDVLSEECKELKELRDKYLQDKIDRLSIVVDPFGSVAARDSYQKRLTDRLSSIDFLQRWKEKKMYSFSISRMNRLSEILG